jgi:hypothetical protein
VRQRPRGRTAPDGGCRDRRGGVGFVGLTCPDPEVYVSAPSLDSDLAGVAIGYAEELRASGADWVVALLHDGVDWRFGGEGYEAHAGHFSEVCRPWAHAVDAIFASHTLGRWIGRVEGTPVVQPWPFGAELGVAALARRHCGGRRRAPEGGTCAVAVAVVGVGLRRPGPVGRRDRDPSRLGRRRPRARGARLGPPGGLAAGGGGAARGRR